MSNFLKNTVIRDTVLSALARKLTLAPTVWRNAGGSFRGEQGDVLTIRVPAFTNANTRDLRSGGPRERRGLFESSVQIPLSDEVYRDIPLTDENQTLDILNFSRQVMNPALTAVARGVDDILLADAVQAASYEYEVDVSESSPYAAVVQARKHLNDARVPFENRFLAVGSSIEAALIQSPQFARADQSGTTQTLREGEIGRIAGFTVLTVPGLAPEEAYAYHETAYALAIQAPVVPDSVTAGFTVVQDGFALRLVQMLDSELIRNIISVGTYVGAAPVTDSGTIDDDGVFTPSESIAGSFHPHLFVRAVKLELSGSG